MLSTPQKSTIDGMTTSQHPRPTTTDDSRDHRRRRHKAVILGVTIVALALGWWSSPVLGGVVTLVASVVGAAVLAPGPIGGDRRSAGGDGRNDSIWYQ